MALFLPSHQSCLKSSNRIHGVSETLLWLDSPHSIPINIYWSSVPCQGYTDQTSLPNHPHKCSPNTQNVRGHDLCIWMEYERRDGWGIQNLWQVVLDLCESSEKWDFGFWQGKKDSGKSRNAWILMLCSSEVGVQFCRRICDFPWTQFPSIENKHTAATSELLRKCSQETSGSGSSPCPITWILFQRTHTEEDVLFEARSLDSPHLFPSLIPHLKCFGHLFFLSPIILSAGYWNHLLAHR